MAGDRGIRLSRCVVDLKREKKESENFVAVQCVNINNAIMIYVKCWDKNSDDFFEVQVSLCSAIYLKLEISAGTWKCG